MRTFLLTSNAPKLRATGHDFDIPRAPFAIDFIHFIPMIRSPRLSLPPRPWILQRPEINSISPTDCYLPKTFQQLKSVQLFCF